MYVFVGRGFTLKTVLDILTETKQDLTSVKPTDSVLTAIKLMSERDLGALPVLSGTQLVGVISERDYTRKVTLKNRTADKTLVRDVMTSDVYWISATRTLEDCLKLMKDRQVRHMPVMHDNKIIGFVSVLDVVQSMMNEHSKVVSDLQEYVSKTWPF